MRRTFYLGVAASLLLAFAQAPFSHTHRTDPHHGHARSFVHAHWRGHAPSDPAWENRDHDSDARALNWFAGDGKSPVKLPATLPETVILPAPAAQPSPVRELTTHSHDPPWARSLNPRAPPV